MQYHIYYEHFNERTMVINRRTTDTFAVHDDFKCWINGKRCWKQLYTGLHCRHSLLAVLEKLNSSNDVEERKSICRQAVQLCHTNWLRSTYSAATRPFDIAEPPPISVLTRRNARSKDVREQLTRRFREVTCRHNMQTSLHFVKMSAHACADMQTQHADINTFCPAVAFTGD